MSDVTEARKALKKLEKAKAYTFSADIDELSDKDVFKVMEQVLVMLREKERSEKQ